MKKEIQSFLDLFGGKNIIVASNGKTSMSRCALSEAITKNQKGSDIYFIINPSKGLKNTDVTHLICNYVDLDAGKNSDGSYFDLKKVASFKKKALARVKEFSPAPTAIVETRNGYHLYWNYQFPVPANYLNRSHWREIQDKILSFFVCVGGDKEVQKVNQLLRVPYTKWQKTWAGTGQTFDVKLTKRTDLKKCSTFAEIVQLFSNLKFDEKKVGKKKNFKTGEIDWDAAEKCEDGKCSYNKRNDFNGNKRKKNGPQTETEMVSFLSDLSQVLYAKGMKYFSAQCKDMADKIRFK
jgi:hypothetical protein